MKESSKTNRVRSKEFFKNYLQGSVIDIGGGNDSVVDNAEVFDMQHGDAQNILKYKNPKSFDCVYSSHCLEHMQDAPLALSEWWELVKVDGFMIIVVPHEDLYEQKIWPSFICGEGHRASFRLQTSETWSPASFDIYELAQNLSNSSIISAEIQDLNYDYGLLGKRLGKASRKIYKWRYSKNKFKQFISESIFQYLRDNYWIKSNNKSGRPVDQTAWNALAQIQIVIKKLS
mgnify:FL=1|jgi:SAM-dependent methyltransferase